jgi:chromosome segregation ATPase
MEHSLYYHFLSRAQEGAKAVVMLAGDRDRTRWFADQAKLTHALVRDLDEDVKAVKLLGEDGEEASQKITEMEALCKKLREDAQKLKEENTKLEGMVESRDELITEIAKEIGLDRMGEDVEAEDEDDDNGGDAAAPTTPAPVCTKT